MQNVRRKTHAATPRKRLAWLLAALVLLAAVAAGTLLLDREIVDDTPESISTAANLFVYAPEDVVAMTIRRGSEDPWTVEMQDGQMVLTGENGFPLSTSVTTALQDAACILPCEAVLTDDPAEYSDHLDDFGLDAPRYEAIITYADGVVAHLRIGNAGADNNAWYYMTIDGDDRLFTFSRGMVESLFVSRDSLWEVSSPTIHKARIDRVTLTGPNSMTEWTLVGDITDSDAIDRWCITAPLTYPADADTMSTLLANMANLCLGAYVGPATPENLSSYGFDAPRLTMEIHMAPGTIAVTTLLGEAQATDYPEETVTFIIGGAKNDMVDYVCFDGNIYISSHFTMGMFIDYDVKATMSRYPVMVALGNLAQLTIIEPEGTFEYVLTRTEQVAQNNELVTDDDGNVVYDITVHCNGELYDYDTFAAAYNAASLVTVSGVLPGNYTLAEPTHRYIFTDVDGTVHEVGLTTFDALHDAVIVDGYAAFYLIKGGFFATRP